MADRRPSDTQTVSPLIDADRSRLLSPNNEWAISSPEPVSPAGNLASGSNGITDEITRAVTAALNNGRHGRTGQRVSSEGSQQQEPKAAATHQREKRGSSETRNGSNGHLATATATLLKQDVQRQKGDHEGLQELRSEIDMIKAGKKTSVNGLGVSDHSLARPEGTISELEEPGNEADGEQPERDGLGQLPSPPPSVGARESPPAMSAGAESGMLELRRRDAKESKARVETVDAGVRIRASSSGLDLRAPAETRLLPDPLAMKQRTMSASTRPASATRAQTAPTFRRKGSSSKSAAASTQEHAPPPRLNKELPPLKMDRAFSRGSASGRHQQQDVPGPASPIPEIMPLPPFTMPAFLQLELSSNRPSPLYMYRPSTTESLYEPTSVKFERLLNFLYLPPQLERVLWFGAIACVDAWLYNFTILPIRFCNAVVKLVRSMIRNCWAEAKFVVDFVPVGLNRVWQRQVSGIHTENPTPVSTPIPTPVSEVESRLPATNKTHPHFPFPQEARARENPPVPRMSRPRLRRHRRTRSVASTLVSAEKADLLKGLLIITSTIILMRFDASMMYHSIRGQAAIKLYVIYNVLEVFDKLFSAIGQDILECLFSPESLSRKPDGRSKILRPLSLFPLALIYVLIHAAALYYQVITLNVAVNSYSNALLTLLMSNQFVEIKSTVFKRIEKENLFQMTCADVVERFQLWLMLMIIASRNIIETSAGSSSSPSGPVTSSTPPPTTPTLLPFSFTLFPSLSSASQILSPFILVLGTEMLVDWLKHAYITKFNNVKPNLYGRFLDVLAKDYYANAFSDPNLTKRIGLPVIPLTCLAIRAAVQTYNMALEQLGPVSSGITEFDASNAAALSPTTVAALRHIDALFLRVVGGVNATSGSDSFTATATPGATGVNIAGMAFLPSSILAPLIPTTLLASLPSSDTLLSLATSAVLIAALFLVLLAAKLVLGMLLLGYARARYARMKRREAQLDESSYQEGRRGGGWGTVELGEDKRRWIYVDDPDRLKKLRDRDRDVREKEGLPPTMNGNGGGSAGMREERASTAKDAEETAGTREAKDSGRDGKDGKDGRDARDTATTATARKTQNYETVERYKLGGSKRIW